MNKAEPVLQWSPSQHVTSHSKELDPTAVLQVKSVFGVHAALGAQYFLKDSRLPVLRYTLLHLSKPDGHWWLLIVQSVHDLDELHT